MIAEDDIADGNAANRRSTARLVEALGYQALQAPGIGAAVKQLEDPDLDPTWVLLGFDLQDANSALAHLRSGQIQGAAVLVPPA